MNDETIQHIADDGSIYHAEIVPPEGDSYDAKYHVDLVRTTTHPDGLGREQRLTVGQYSSWMEAEEHQQELEDGLSKDGLASFGDDAQRLNQQPFDGDVFYLTAIYPPDGAGITTAHLLAIGETQISPTLLGVGERDTLEAQIEPIDRALADDDIADGLALAQPTSELEDVRHVDGGGTAHWFGVVANDEPETPPYELRYFRELAMDDGTQRNDSYAVMALPDAYPDPWPLQGLEMYLLKGDVFMAQQLAHDVSANNGGDFPNPLDIPALDPQPEYYFGYGTGENNRPSLEAVKTWMDGAERRFDTLTINEYDSYDDAAVDEYILENRLETDGLEQAMNLAEQWAVSNGYLDPERSDGRIFFEDDAPADPFQTQHEREIARDLSELESDEFDFIFNDDPDPSYPSMYREAAEEAHRNREARASLEGVAWFESGFTDKQLIEPLDDTVNYAFVVQDTDPWTLELMVDKYWKAPHGYVGFDSVTLKTYDPDDESEREQAEQDREALMQSADDLEGIMQNAEQMAVENGYLKADRANPSLFRKGPPDRFETLAERLQTEISMEPQEAENPYWRMETLPVNNPDGEPLGHALQMVVYPYVEHDPDLIGTPALAENEPFRMLEMAHFETIEAADKFSQEFNGYLLPVVLKAPDLAVEVARLEGLPIKWKTLEGNDLKAYQDVNLSLTLDPEDWHPYNPNAEREARIEAEGLYYDPIQKVVKLDEDEGEPKIEPISPNFDF